MDNTPSNIYRWINIHLRPVRVAAISPGGSIAATGGDDGALVFIDIPTGTVLHLTQLDTKVRPLALLWIGENDLIVTSTDKSVVFISITRTGTLFQVSRPLRIPIKTNRNMPPSRCPLPSTSQSTFPRRSS